MNPESLDRTLTALADPNRRRVVDLLCERPRRAGELAEAVQLPFPAMSRHLRALRASGLVEEDRHDTDSRVRIYRLKQEPMNELKEWLEQIERHWMRQLAAFKAHIQKTRK